jgi:hypothetical protein
MWCVNPKEGLRVATLLWQVGLAISGKNGNFKSSCVQDSQFY